MTNWSHVLNVPLALLAGAAVASNPHLFAPGADAEGKKQSPVEAIRAQEPSTAQLASAVARRGPESPELMALRLAEDQFFAESYADAGPAGGQWEGDDDSVDQFTPMPGNGAFDGLNQPNFPISRHYAVEKYVNYFSTSPKGRELFTKWLRRSGRYRPMIAQALMEQGLPSDLEAVVFVESGFWPTAKSHAGAVGLWQFMPATARAYGLTVNKEFDERRSPWRATDAAARHLTDLYARVKSWDLALASYNYGFHNVEARLNDAGTDDFWDVVDVEGTLPEETRKYVPKVHAVALVLNNLDHFGFGDVQMDAPLQATAFEVPPGTKLATLARASGMSARDLSRLNPQFLAAVVPDRGAPVAVHLPNKSLSRARVMLPRLLGDGFRELTEQAPADFDWGASDQQNDTMARLQQTIVKRKQDPVWNPLMGRSLAKTQPAPSTKNETEFADEMLSILSEDREPQMSLLKDAPLMSLPEEGEADPETLVSSVPNEKEVTFITYRVRPGDSVSKLATRFSVSEGELIYDNQIRNPAIIYKGRELKIRDALQSPQRGPVAYKVRPGDSLSKIARRVRDEELRLAQRNDIENPNHIRIGQIVWINPR